MGSAAPRPKTHGGRPFKAGMMGEIDCFGPQTCDPQIEGNVTIGPEAQVTSRSRIRDVPFGNSPRATEIADPVEKTEERAKQGHHQRVAVQLGSVVQRIDRRRRRFAEENDGEQAEAFEQMFRVRRRPVGFGGNKERGGDVQHQRQTPTS